jgi:branched-chain amino acid transport system permease protein
MQFWIIQGLNSLSLGGLLFLLSSGFSLIFGLMRLANLTHGAFFMLGTYFGATALRAYDGLNIWVTALGAGIAVAAIGGLFERLVLTRLKTNPLGQVLVTLGMSFIISDACLLLWGGDSIPVPTPQNLQSPTRVLGFVFPTYRLVLVGCAIGAAIVLYFLLASTTGRWRARSESRSQICLRWCFAWARESPAPVACWADRSCPLIPGLMVTCFRWR